MSYSKSSLLRKLIPKSYHFDGYNELNYPNTRDKPFFTENVVQIGDYFLTTRIDSGGNLILEYSSVCPNGIISFKPYILSFESFIELLRTALDEGSDVITFEIQTSYKYTDGNCTRCVEKNKDCSFLLKNKPSTVMAAVSFEVTDIKNALSVYFGINKPQTFKGGNTMKKNILGMNFEWGLSKDRNIAATLMGVAVKNPENGNWYVFDSVKHTRTNIAGMKMGDLPVYLLPTNVLNVGDLTKIDGKYFYVQAIDQNYFTLLGAADGFVRQMLPSESIIPGMTLYTKVVAFDVKTLTDPNSKENLSGNVIAALCLSQWSKGESEFSLDNINDDSFNGLGSCLPVLMALNGSNGLGNMFGSADGGLNLPLLMMMGSGNSSDEANNTIQLILLNQVLSGGNSMFGQLPGVTTTAPSTISEGEVYCPSCGATYPAGTNFCSKCGEATQVKGKVCTHCGTTLHDGAAFCHNCGQKVVNDTCPSCGAKITPDSMFCSSCGASLKKVAPTKTVGGKKSPARKASSGKTSTKGNAKVDDAATPTPTGE